jgi:hypothetical protein
VLVARFFAAPEQREPPAEVMRRLRAGAFGSFHVFKFHLVMSLQADEAAGVVLGDVWRFWASQSLDPERLHRHTGWPLEEILTIEYFRGSEARLWFPTLPQWRAECEAHFELRESITPTYEMGDRCPLFVLARSGTNVASNGRPG